MLHSFSGRAIHWCLNYQKEVRKSRKKQGDLNRSFALKKNATVLLAVSRIANEEMEIEEVACRGRNLCHLHNVWPR